MHVFSRYFWYLSFSVAVFSFGYATGASKSAPPLPSCHNGALQSSMSVQARDATPPVKPRPALLM